ncbi:MAG TPA: hypothetical protein VMN56_21270 [Casimicrobiaceae bacterium]|nr:hypothetical protein [Casimicrobiaceae bacterium]
MRELGYVEGRNVVYVQRVAKGDLDALPGLAKEILAQDVALIVAGGLVSYAPSYPDLFRGAGFYVDGANPATMPIEQPTKFELVVNASAARALGLPIPQAMLARATRVLQ